MFLHRIFRTLVLTALVSNQLELFAQSTTGTILGKITDASGAIVPAAPVRATNTLTSETRSINTNELGEYVFPNLPVGHYRVECDASGFKRSVKSDIELTVNQNARVDIQLELGTMEQSVEVAASPTQVNTATAELGQLVDTKRVQELPLNGRNVYDLITLMPGVSRTSTRVVQSRDNNTLSVNGGRPTTNNFLLDGGFNNDIGATRATPLRTRTRSRSFAF